MSATFKLSMLSPRGKALDGEVDSLVVPAQNGSLGVLAHHAPIIAALRRGVTQVTQGGQISYWVTGAGVLEVSLEGTHLLVDFAEKADTLEQAKEMVAAHLRETGEAAS